jgi:hypothetical protein
MRYFVVGDAGQKYGPADVAVLNQWIVDGRVFPATPLEEEATGARFVASAVPGLQFPATVPPMAPPPSAVPGHAHAPTYAGAYTPPKYAEEDGKLVLVGIGLGVGSLVLNFVLGIGALFLWLAGLGMSWSGRKDRPGLAYLGIAINVIAAACWVYLLIRETQTAINTPTSGFQ